MRKGNKYLFQYRFINVEDVEVTGVVLAENHLKVLLLQNYTLIMV
jgi:hypothetical protein